MHFKNQQPDQGQRISANIQMKFKFAQPVEKISSHVVNILVTSPQFAPSPTAFESER